MPANIPQAQGGLLETLKRYTRGLAYKDQVGAADIQANSILANHITASAITAGKIAADSITGSEIQAGTITGSNIAATTITAANIAAGTITATQIASNTITTGNMAAGSITANGSVVDNTSVSIGTSDTTIGNFSITVQATTDIIQVAGRAMGSISGYDFTKGETITLKLKRGATTVDSMAVSTILSSGGTGSGNFAISFSLFDTGISGSTTYTFTMVLGNSDFTASKTSLLAFAVDYKR